MKRVVFCTVLIAVIFSFSLAGTFIIRKTTDEIKDECLRILAKYETREDVSDDMKEVYLRWNEKSELLSLMVNKDKLDTTGFNLSLMLDSSDMQRGDFISTMNSVIHYLDDIAKDETPEFKNIF